MRGKDSWCVEHRHSARITPAYAGKRLFAVPNCFDVEDHPRVCGEKILSKLPLGNSEGSPPRMRGKADVTQFNIGSSGITPAYAGKSTKAIFAR